MQTAGVQNEPSVAMSPDGTFIVTWASAPNYTGLSNSNSFNSAIFAHEYDQGDVPIGNEFQVTPSSSNANTLPSVALDAHDNFVITWEGDFQSSSTWGIYGDYFTAANGGAVLPTSWTSSGVKLLNQQPNSRGSFTGATVFDLYNTGPRVAMIPNSGTAHGRLRGHLGRFRQRQLLGFRAAIRAQRHGQFDGRLNTASTIMVNPPQSFTGAGWQLMPAVGVDPEGDIGITWTTYGQDNANNGISGMLDYGIYMTIYYSSTSGKGLAGTNSGEFRVNATTLGNQAAPLPSASMTSRMTHSSPGWVRPRPLSWPPPAMPTPRPSTTGMSIRPTRRPAYWCPTLRRSRPRTRPWLSAPPPPRPHSR